MKTSNGKHLVLVKVILVLKSKAQRKSTEYTGDEELLVIFPRIYIVQDGGPSPITPGTVLRRSQSLAAVQELDRNKPSSPIVGKGPVRSRTQKPRRMSVSVHGSSPFFIRGRPIKRAWRQFINRG